MRSLEPFFVTCETCRARLKVRSAAAIGEIHACPRCESMVLIAPPSNGAGQGAEFVDSPPPVRRATQFSRLETPTQEAADAFAAAAVAVLAGATTMPAAESLPVIDVQVQAAAIATPAESVMSPAWKSLVWERPLLLLGGVATAAVLVAGALALVIIPGKDDVATGAPTTPITDVVPAANSTETAAADVPPVPEQSPVDSATSNVGDPARVVAPTPATRPTLVETPAIPPPLMESRQQTTTVADPLTPEAAPVAAAANQDETSLSQQQASPAAQPTSDRGPVFKLDPLNFDPSHLSLPISGVPAPQTGGTLATTSASASPSDVSLASAESPDLAAAAREGAQPEEELSITVRRGPPPIDSTQPRAVAAQLALPIQAMNVRGMPLARFIDQMADMAGVPITLDPSALDMTGVSPRREVAVDVKEVTIDRVLRDALARNRMESVERDGQLVVLRAANSAQLPPTYDVADLLAAGERDAANLAKLIQRFVAPASWRHAGGAGELAVEGTVLQVKQSEIAQIGLIVFCERLRIARGLPPKSRYPIERLSTESPYSRLAAKLNQPTTFTFVPWTRLADMIRDWQQQSGVTILVDWRALADLELAPSSPVSASAIARTWEDALDEILEPLGLAWWAVDGETIQITVQSAGDRLQRVEFFKIPRRLREQFAGDQALAEGLHRELREQTGANAPPSEIEVDGEHLIVLGNASAHRYLTKRLAVE